MNRPLLAAATGVTALTAYCAIAERRDSRRFPPPGRMVDIGGRRVHLWVEGDDGPTVVVLPCIGGAGIEWVGVQRLLCDHAKVCLMDRGGLGWSDPAPWPRTFDRMADELHAALKASDLPRPFVLVGHSTGGLLARLTAARYRDQIAALVLVDSSHEDQADRLPPPPRRWRERRRAFVRRVTPLWWARLGRHLRPSPPPEWLPGDLADTYRNLYLTHRNRRAAVQELAGMAGNHHHLRDEARQLGDLPVTMITAGPDGREDFYPQWLELQAEIAGYSESITRAFAPRSGHHVHHDDPQLVVDVIRGVVDQARARAQ